MRSFAVLSALVVAATTAIAAHGPAHHHHAQVEARAAAGMGEFDGIWIDERDEDGWEDAGFGLMMERDTTPAEVSSLMKREGETTRDLGTTDWAFALNKRGELTFPRSWREVKQGMQVVKRKTLTYFHSTITWYTGHDLLNPACQRHSRWNPTDHSLVAAVTQVWANKPACGEWLKLRPKGSSHSVVVRVVDACGGCKPHVPHVDLTEHAFTKLFSLRRGEAHGIETKKWYRPFHKWTSEMTKLYGPERL